MEEQEALHAGISSRFKILKRLGSGTYGVVYQAIEIDTQRVLALKKIKLNTDGEGFPQTSVREIALLRQLNHPNIVRLEDAIFDNNQKCYLVFEHLDYDLHKFLEDNSEVDMETIKSFIRQLIEGLLYCHTHRVLHRDIKPQNLLVEHQTKKLKIADFGLGRAYSMHIKAYTEQTITRWYRCPEILLGGNKYSCSVDMWSVGCILAELASHKPLFPGDSDIDQLYKIFRILGTPDDVSWAGVGQLPHYTPSFPTWKAVNLAKLLPSLDEQGLDLIQGLLQYDPKKRLSAHKALKHPFLASLVSTSNAVTPSGSACEVSKHEERDV